MISLEYRAVVWSIQQTHHLAGAEELSWSSLASEDGEASNALLLRCSGVYARRAKDAELKLWSIRSCLVVERERKRRERELRAQTSEEGRAVGLCCAVGCRSAVV